MSKTDTREYWDDVKSNYPYLGQNYFHIPGYDCGHRHLYEANKLGDVNCRNCLKAIKNGHNHNLPEGITISSSEKKRLRKIALLELQYGRCVCGALFTPRYNKTTKKVFLGCSNYPNCKNTKIITGI